MHPPEPLTLLLLQIAAIVALSRLVIAPVIRRLGQPLVIAEVIAGVLLGPSVLGLLAPHWMGWLFPASSLETLKIFSQVGLVLYMFLVGLELDPALLIGRGQSSVAISHSSIVFPFLLGAVAAVSILVPFAPPQVAPVPFALFIGVAMSITAFPVLARILAEQNLLRTPMGTLAMACAAIDDATAWTLLAFVVAVAQATGLHQAAWTFGLSIAFVLSMVFVVRPLLHRLSATVAKQGGLTAAVTTATLLLLFCSAAATEAIGIHALFGAFLFGAILPRRAGMAHQLGGKLETLSTTVFLPLFFAYSGLRTQLGLLDTANEWLVCAAIIALATAGKFGGTVLAARMTRLPWRESCALGVLMNTRGLMELIVLNIGLDLGVISPTLFTMMVIMALFTTVVTTPLLRWMYPAGALAARAVSPSVPAPDARGPSGVEERDPARV